jgi:hypothetical protein
MARASYAPVEGPWASSRYDRAFSECWNPAEPALDLIGADDSDECGATPNFLPSTRNVLVGRRQSFQQNCTERAPESGQNCSPVEKHGARVAVSPLPLLEFVAGAARTTVLLWSPETSEGPRQARYASGPWRGNRGAQEEAWYAIHANRRAAMSAGTTSGGTNQLIILELPNAAARSAGRSGATFGLFMPAYKRDVRNCHSISWS